ncbi:MAG: bifunctional folylpolyglutamate synthase/dihydrofolate synthase [Polyangiales bacterium]
MTDLGESLARLYALSKRGARRDLEGMREACALDGDPQDRVRSVHVAGTNGKGSVCAMLESIARAAGIRAGLYTSPHLVKFSERIRIDGAPIEDAVLEHHMRRVLDRHPALTFFEVATLVAFHVFAEAQVELAILEVGLGGRLDATNVVRAPLATAITTIGYDHTEWLGETIEAIAAEKAGILKSHVPVVTGPLPRAAMQVVEDRATGPIWRVGSEIVHVARGEHLVVRGPDRSISVTPHLAGEHQRDNTAIAIGLSWLLRSGDPALGIEDPAIARGVANVEWPGRLEEIDTVEGAVLLDGAHNEQGARALGAAIDARGAEHRALVFGAMADKAWGTMVRELAPRFAHRVYVAPVVGTRSAADPGSLATLDPGGEIASDVGDALVRARRAVGANGLVVVAGSLYLVGEARARLLGLERDPQVGL